MVHGQGEDLPTGKLTAGEGHGAIDSLPLVAQFAAEIDPAGTFHQNVEAIAGMDADFYAIFLLPAIHDPNKSSVDINAGIAAQFGQNQAALCRGVQRGSIEDVAIRLTESFHVARLFYCGSLWQVRPEWRNLF